MIAVAGLDLLEVAFAAGLSLDAGSTSGTFLQNAAANGDVPTVALCISMVRTSRRETPVARQPSATPVRGGTCPSSDSS